MTTRFPLTGLLSAAVSGSMLLLCGNSSDGSHPGHPKTAVRYGVEYVPGGIDRVVLTKRDTARNLCIQVTLASPGMLDVEVPQGSVELPPNWSLERAFLVRDAKACDSKVRRWPEGAIHVAEISGSVRWGKSPTEKTVVDLRLSFTAMGSEPAFTEVLSFKR
jgi:hypothetical protein